MYSLFFCVTIFLSIWTLKYYQWNHRLPGYDRAQLSSQNIDPDKAAFSLAPHDEEAYAPVNMDDQDHDDNVDGSHYGGASSVVGGRSDYSDPYGPGTTSHVGATSTVSSYHDNPFRQQEASPFDGQDTEYHGSISAASRYGATPAASAADGFEDARFPQADYDRISRP